MDKKLLEALRGGSTEGESISPEEALSLMRLASQIAQLDLAKVAEEKESRKTPIEKAVEKLKKQEAFSRRLKAKGRRPKLHYKTKKKRRKAYDKKRYYEVRKPRRKAEVAERLTTVEGWWVHLTETWEQMGVEVTMTQDEFTEVIYPAFYPRVPIFFRYDKQGKIELGNLLVRDSDTREVLFDGKEYLLRIGGYIL